MEQKRFESVAAIKGSMSQRNVANPGAFERANYLKILSRWR
jgi:dihydroorotate dehydrogenase (fumarate)